MDTRGQGHRGWGHQRRGALGDGDTQGSGHQGTRWHWGWGYRDTRDGDTKGTGWMGALGHREGVASGTWALKTPGDGVTSTPGDRDIGALGYLETRDSGDTKCPGEMAGTGTRGHRYTPWKKQGVGDSPDATTDTGKGQRTPLRVTPRARGPRVTTWGHRRVGCLTVRGRRACPHGAALPAEAGAGGCKERGRRRRGGQERHPASPPWGLGEGWWWHPGVGDTWGHSPFFFLRPGRPRLSFLRRVVGSGRVVAPSTPGLSASDSSSTSPASSLCPGTAGDTGWHQGQRVASGDKGTQRRKHGDRETRR